MAWDGGQVSAEQAVVVLMGMGHKEGGSPGRFQGLQGKKGELTPRPPALTPADPASLPGTVMLEPATVTPSLLQVPEFIHVLLKVPSVWPPYRHSISVPAGSSLEDVLMKAQELGGFM